MLPREPEARLRYASDISVLRVGDIIQLEASMEVIRQTIVELEVKRRKGTGLIDTILIAQCPKGFYSRADVVCELCRELVAEIVQRILRHRDTRSTMLLRHIEVVKAETPRITEEAGTRRGEEPALLRDLGS